MISGGLGFVGLALANRLVRRGDRVILVDARDPDPADRPRLPASKTVEIVQTDIANANEVAELFSNNGPIDALIHLAAVRGGVSESNPVEATSVNCCGSAMLLEACRQVGARRVVVASSIAVYGDDSGRGHERLPLVEDSPLHLAPSQRLYAAGKTYLESLALTYAQRGLSTCALRLAIVFGAGRKGGAGGVASIAKDMIERPAVGKPAEVMYAPSANLTYAYVDDVAAQLEILCYAQEDLLMQRRIFNSSAESVTVGAIADAVRLVLPDADITMGSDAGPVAGVVSAISDRAFRETFEFEPSFGFQSGVAAQIAAVRATHH